MGDARDGFGEVFRVALLEAAVDRAGERHLAVLHPHLDLGGVDMRILGEAVVHVLQDAGIGALIAARAAAAMLAGLAHVPVAAALGVLVAEPGPDLVAGPLEEAALLVVVARAAPEAVRAVAVAPVGVPLAPAFGAEERLLGAALVADHVAPVEGRAAGAVAGGIPVIALADLALEAPAAVLVRAPAPAFILVGAAVVARAAVAEAAPGDVAVVLPVAPVEILIAIAAVGGHGRAPPAGGSGRAEGGPLAQPT